MGLVNFVTRAFIDVFGITHPDAKNQRVAGWFITGLLALIVAGIVIFLATLYHLSR